MLPTRLVGTVAVFVAAACCCAHPPPTYPHPKVATLTWDATFGANLLDQPATSLSTNGAQIAVAGAFTRVGALPTPGVAIWDGSTAAWQALPALPSSGAQSFTALSFANGTDLLVGGMFPAAVGYWHGGAWSATASGLQGLVSAMLWSSGGFYLGGAHFISGNHADAGVGYFDVNGGVWGTLGAFVTSAPASHVWTLASDGSLIYAGGTQLDPGGAVARYDPANRSWAGLGLDVGPTGQSAIVESLAFESPYLYACGQFSAARNSNGTLPLRNVARWNIVTSLWEDFGGGVLGACEGLAVRNGHVFVTGLFSMAGSQPATNAARWDPVARVWGPMGSGLQLLHSVGQAAQGTRVAIVGDDLDASAVFVGIFDTAGGQPATGVARWEEGYTGGTWSAVHRHLMPGPCHHPPCGCLSRLDVGGTIMGAPGTSYSLQLSQAQPNPAITNLSIIPAPLTNGSGVPTVVPMFKQCVPENGGPAWVRIETVGELLPVFVEHHG